jgi:tetratricopeptide (TPR) repeat protein
MKERLSCAILVWLVLGLSSASAQSNQPLDDAKTLYDSASFDEALQVLDNLGRTQPETDVEEVQHYRALCLLALNRTNDAQKAIEIVFSRDPLYRLSPGEAPPRMQAAFAEVRKRLLPSVTEQLYASAKLSFDRKEYALAATQFQDLLTFLDEDDAKSLPSLKEFRMLATGFHDLSASAAAVNVAKSNAPAPTPAPAPPETVPAPQNNARATAANQIVPASQGPPPAQAAPSQPVTDDTAGGVLQPPVVIRQQMPIWVASRTLLPKGSSGKLRLIIDERGNVEDARMVESVHSVYDALLISATRLWKYEPAKLDGKPVRYAKIIQIVLNPAP